MLSRILIVIPLSLCGLCNSVFAQLDTVPHRGAQSPTNWPTILIGNVAAPSWCQHLRHPREDVCGSIQQVSPKIGTSSFAKRIVWPQTASANDNLAWHVLRIGPSAYMTGLDLVTSDNTAVVREDQYGCAIQATSVSTPVWTQLLTVQAMPANSVTNSSGAPLGGGCDEIVIDRSNTSNLWLEYNGNLYKSTNKGISFSVTAYPAQPGQFSPAQNSPIKALAPYVAVDPNNSSVIYASTPSQGLEFTNNAGTSFSQVTSVAAGIPPAPSTAGMDSTNVTTCTGTVSFSSNSANFRFTGGDTNYVQVYETSDAANSMYGTVHAASGATFSLTVVSKQGTCSHSDWTVTNQNSAGGGHIIAFDTSHGTTTVGGQTRTAYVYECTYGLGVYASTDGGQTWTLTPGTPTTCLQMVVDPNGVLWFVAYPSNNNVWTYRSGTWARNMTIAPFTGDAYGIAIDPNNCTSEGGCHIAVAGNNILYYTANGGSNWNTKKAFSFTADDVPWMRLWQTNFHFMGVGGIKFDSSGKLFWSDEGVWYTTPSTSGSTVALTLQAAGLEGLEGNGIISPSGASGTVIAYGWDVGCLYSNNLNVYPSAATCAKQYASGLSHAYFIDQAAGTSDIVVLADNQCVFCGSPAFYSGISNDNGTVGSWSSLTPPMGVSAGCAPSGCIGGCMAAASGSNILWAPTDSQGGNIAPFYTTNSGSSWSQISVTGATGGWPWRYYLNSKSCAADRASANTFYLYNWNLGDGNNPADAIVKCTGGGASCKIQSRPGFGPNQQYNPVLKTVPGRAGYLFFADGILSPPTNNWSNGFYYYSDGGITKNTIAGFSGVTAFGFGGDAPGHSFPTIWAAGWYNNVYGIWRCEVFDTDQCGSTSDWTGFSGYPNGWPLPILDLDGDKGTSTQVYGVTGSGAFWGNFNYLFNRDLDPTSNDNSPAFLNAAS
jgi:hypothetical protein